MPFLGDIPDIVKHVTMRIYSKPPRLESVPPPWMPEALGSDSEHFILSFHTAVRALTTQGYVGLGASIDPTGKIKLTGKGQERNARHTRDNPSASASFDALYTRAYATVESKGGFKEGTREILSQPVLEGGRRKSRKAPQEPSKSTRTSVRAPRTAKAKRTKKTAKVKRTRKTRRAQSKEK